MQDLCPLCLKKGVKKKIRLLQINLQEAVWMCEEEKCTWPLGYEDFAFYPRIVGKIWSCYWDDYKALPKVKEACITPTKLALCSVPMINVKDTSTNCITDSNLDTNHSGNNVNNLYKDSTDNLSLKNSNSQSVNEDTENIRNEKKLIVSFDKHVEDRQERQDSYTQNVKNGHNAKGIPKITSIEKTNIDISNVIKGNQSSVNQDLHEKLVISNKTTNDASNKLICLTDHKILSSYSPESQKLLNLEPFDSNKLNNELAMTEFKLNANVIETDNTLPVTVSIKIPTSFVTENVISSIQQSNCKSNNTRDIVGNIKKPSSKCSPVKRNVTSGKQYEKFSFSAIKKKIKENTTDTKNNDVISLRSNSKMKDTENDAICSTIKENTTANVNDNTINQNNECTASDTSILNTSVNIDTVIDDLLSNDYSVSEDINDEWLNSLLS